MSHATFSTGKEKKKTSRAVFKQHQKRAFRHLDRELKEPQCYTQTTWLENSDKQCAKVIISALAPAFPPTSKCEEELVHSFLIPCPLLGSPGFVTDFEFLYRQSTAARLYSKSSHCWPVSPECLDSSGFVPSPLLAHGLSHRSALEPTCSSGNPHVTVLYKRNRHAGYQRGTTNFRRTVCIVI